MVRPECLQFTGGGLLRKYWQGHLRRPGLALRGCFPVQDVSLGGACQPPVSRRVLQHDQSSELRPADHRHIHVIGLFFAECGINQLHGDFFASDTVRTEVELVKNMLRILLAKFLNGKISRRELSDRILGLGLGMATVESVLDTVTPAKAESFHPEPFSEPPPYEQWMAKEGVPIHTGYSTPNVRTLEVKPWSRLGVQGSLVDLQGAEGTDGAYILQLAPGQTTKPQRYMFEESVFVLEGEGESTIWQNGGPKQTFR